jgi:methionine-rich copper-binding protein CopC
MPKPLLIAAALAGVLLATSSFGHARLVDSTPASGGHITAATPSVTLSFSEEVKLASLTLTSAGKRIAVTIDKSAPSAKTVVVPVPSLAPGAYELHWTAVSTDDGHVTKGFFTFTVSGT